MVIGDQLNLAPGAKTESIFIATIPAQGKGRRSSWRKYNFNGSFMKYGLSKPTPVTIPIMMTASRLPFVGAGRINPI